MCGIIAFIPNDITYAKAGKKLVEQYQRQHNRGTRGFGLMQITKNSIEIDRSVEPTKALLDCYMMNNGIGVFHHRLPTSTDNEIEQTHPFTVSHGELKFDWHVIHNGVIRNAEELRKHHMDELGYVYSTYHPTNSTYRSSYGNRDFNDSEALAVEVARYFEGRQESINAFGTIAFIAIKSDKKTGRPLEMYWGRNEGNPLEIVELPEGLLIASAIYHEDAEIVTAMTYEMINLKKYFAAKQPFASIIKLIMAAPCSFKEEVKVVTSTQSLGFPSQPNSPSVGFGAGQATSQTSSNPRDPEEDAAHSGYSTPRESAFEKMAVRIINDFAEEIYDFCGQMAYREMSEDDIIDVASKLQDILIEKNEIAGKRIRPFFDKKEEREAEEDYAAATAGTDPLLNDEDEDVEMAVTQWSRNGYLD